MRGSQVLGRYPHRFEEGNLIVRNTPGLIAVDDFSQLSMDVRFRDDMIMDL